MDGGHTFDERVRRVQRDGGEMSRLRGARHLNINGEFPRAFCPQCAQNLTPGVMGLPHVVQNFSIAGAGDFHSSRFTISM